jgi:hypothetical protein
LSVDPLVEQTQQPYGYADHNPANEVDPSGLLSANANKAMSFFMAHHFSAVASAALVGNFYAESGMNPGLLA